MYANIDFNVSANGIAKLHLNRPQLNVLSPGMLDDITQAAQVCASDSSVRAVLITHSGRFFSAGGDLLWMRKLIHSPINIQRSEARRLAKMYKAVYDIPVPTIALVHGNTYGGGVGILCAVDAALAADDAKLVLTEPRLGLVPAVIGPYLAARIGASKAAQLLLSNPLAAEDAKRLGIFSDTAKSAAISDLGRDRLAEVLRWGPNASRTAKGSLRSYGPALTDAVVDASIDLLVDSWNSREAHDGILSFLEKHPPAWVAEYDIG